MTRAALPVAALLTGLSGCAGLPPLGELLPDGAPVSVEIDSTPFFPQEAFQCGPAALATLLTASGVPTTPDLLVEEVFLPARSGSLQAELLGSTRRNGRLAYVLPPRTDALLAELIEGRPVLVLQNLGIEAYPVWHYAVLVGYDERRGVAVLRSGKNKRLETRWRRFVGSWQRGGGWAFTALVPGTIPAAAEPGAYLAAAAGLEAAGRRTEAAAAYEAAIGRWPDAPLAWLGAGNVAYATGDFAGAVRALARGVLLAPGNPVIRNNLAQALIDAGCPEEAVRQAQTAVRLARDTTLEADASATRASAERALARAASVGACAATTLPRADAP